MRLLFKNMSEARASILHMGIQKQMSDAAIRSHDTAFTQKADMETECSHVEN